VLRLVVLDDSYGHGIDVELNRVTDFYVYSRRELARREKVATASSVPYSEMSDIDRSAVVRGRSELYDACIRDFKATTRSPCNSAQGRARDRRPIG
jgi:hypothetical protein